MTAVACPRCRRPPIAVTELGRADPELVPACSCYPHPPLCVCCHQPLEDDRCATLGCPVYDVLQPLPDVDPLWDDVCRPDDPPTVVEPCPAFERMAALMAGDGKRHGDAMCPAEFGPLGRTA